MKNKYTAIYLFFTIFFTVNSVYHYHHLGSSWRNATMCLISVGLAVINSYWFINKIK